mgnify:CR=1 FL=1
MGRTGVMIDSSRNAVRSVETIKKWIDISRKMEFNSIFKEMI